MPKYQRESNTPPAFSFRVFFRFVLLYSLYIRFAGQAMTHWSLIHDDHTHSGRRNKEKEESKQSRNLCVSSRYYYYERDTGRLLWKQTRGNTGTREERVVEKDKCVGGPTQRRHAPRKREAFQGIYLQEGVANFMKYVKRKEDWRLSKKEEEDGVVVVVVRARG